MPTNKILVTGSGGQIGRVLVERLKKQYGSEAVVATDVRPSAYVDAVLDCTDSDAVQNVVDQIRPQHIYHLAAILSATGEHNPSLTWDVNSLCWLNILEAARKFETDRIFFPSSIAVYGPGACAGPVSDTSPTRPMTMYGITKASGENLAAYYASRYAMDIRTLRYPGIIGWESEPGGGTTDYAVEIFHAAVRGKTFICPLSPHRRLPMLAMHDAMTETLAFMEAALPKINHRHGYNIGGFNVTPAELALLIKQFLPDFQIQYMPDRRDEIAQGWPQAVDDSQARTDWGWQVEYDLFQLAEAMLAHCAADFAAEEAQVQMDRMSVHAA